MKNRLLFCTAALCLFGLTLGCSDEDEVRAEPLPYPPLSEAEPVVLSKALMGTGVRHGEAVYLAHQTPEQMVRATRSMSHAFFHVQVYDEFAPTLGEYLVNPAPPGVTDRTASSFSGSNASAGRLVHRASDLVTELTDASAHAQADGFTELSFVIDFWRSRRDWYVRWDGNIGSPHDVGKSNYGFYRRDLQDDVLGQIESIAQTFEPTYIVVGSEMERFFATDAGEGISIVEYSNFVGFYIEAARRIREVSPQTKVSAGINWDRFVGHVVPAFTGAEEIDDAAIDMTFEAILLPLMAHSDVLALMSYTKVANVDEAHYQFLRRLPALYELEKPVVWYSVGSPIETPGAALEQRTYLSTFLSWNAGVPVEAIAWRGLMNFEGSETSTGEIIGRCRTMTSPDRNFLMALQHCYDGLFTGLSAKPVFTYIEENVQ